MDTCGKTSPRWSDGDLGGWTPVARFGLAGQLEIPVFVVKRAVGCSFSRLL